MNKKITDSSVQAKMRTLYTIDLSEEQMAQLEIWCSNRNWCATPVQHARFSFKGDQIHVVGYRTGKLVIQGKKTESFVTDVLEPEITKKAQLNYEAVLHPEWFEPHAGLDESGKGDVFGPIVSACVIADKRMVEHWLSIGVRDSKRITSDTATLKFAKAIRETPQVVIKTTFMSMQKYNSLYLKLGSNMNTLLAWMHAQSLQKALDQRFVSWGLLDQFSKQPLVQKQIKVANFQLNMRPRAEEDPVVAAASIIARSVYLEQMHKLSEQAGFSLQKGASTLVQNQLNQLITKLGPQSLFDFAKMHFRTVQQALNYQSIPANQMCGEVSA
jgi:ribonuclease HIII